MYEVQYVHVLSPCFAIIYWSWDIFNFTAFILHYQALTQEKLIKKLNPILRGWSNYHRNVCSKKTFRHISHNLYLKLQRWATRKHPKKNVKWIEHRYWHKDGNNNWTFSDGKNVLFDIASVKIERRTLLKTDMNPFLNWEYFADRKKTLQKTN